MEIYLAIGCFSPPNNSGGYKVLAFEKGDRFEVLESKESRDKKIWWGARLLLKTFEAGIPLRDIPEDQEVIGFVPASYLKFDQTVKLRNLSDKQKLRRQSCLDLLATMSRSRQEPRHDDLILPPPDYDGAPTSGGILLQTGAPPPPKSPKGLPKGAPASPKVLPKGVPPRSPELPPKLPPRSPLLPPKQAPTSPLHSPSIARNPELSYLTESPRAAAIDPRYLEDHTDETELVQPRKLVNPCMESRERLDLHKELIFNQKRGIDVLGQKSELQKEMERRQEAGKKKEKEIQQKVMEKGKRNSFQMQLDKQAEKLKEYEEQKAKVAEEESKPQAEFLKAHARIRKHQDSPEQTS